MFLILLSNAYDIFVAGCMVVSIASCCVDIAGAAWLFGLVKVSCEDVTSDDMYGNVALYSMSFALYIFFSRQIHYF